MLCPGFARKDEWWRNGRNIFGIHGCNCKGHRLVLDNVFPTTTNHFHPKMRRIFRIQQCGRIFHGICKFGKIVYAPFGFKVAVLMQMTQDLIIVTGLLAKVDSNRDSSSLLDYIIWWMWDNICYKLRCNSRNLSSQLTKTKVTSGIKRTPECWSISIRIY